MSDPRSLSPYFNASVRLYQDSWSARSTLLDLSLHGLLVSRPDTWPEADPSASFDAIIDLVAREQIHLEARLAFVRHDQIGLTLVHMDLDSASQLKQLIRLTLADPALADRVLPELGS